MVKQITSLEPFVHIYSKSETEICHLRKYSDPLFSTLFVRYICPSIGFSTDVWCSSLGFGLAQRHTATYASGHRCTES